MPAKQPIKESGSLVPVEIIQNKIYLIRNQKVMLDRDLALLYGVTTGNLNKTVKRNQERFPNDFMFQLTQEETDSLIFQIGRPNEGRGGSRFLSYVFTEQGIAMLSSVLKSRSAVQIFDAIRRMMATPEQTGPEPYKRHKVGYIAVKEEEGQRPIHG